MTSRFLLIALLFLAAPSFAQDDDTEALIDEAARAISDRAALRAESAQYTQRAVRAFLAGQYPQAEEILREQLAIDAGNFVVHYNLACALAMQLRPDEANGALRRAIELGFSNRVHLENDPYLRSLHGTDAFRALLEHWDGVIGMQRQVRLEHARGWVRGRTIERGDETLRFDLISAHDEPSTDQALVEIRRVASWSAGVMPGVDRPERAPFVTVILPDAQDFLKWAMWTYGQLARRAFSGIGGAYEHDDKRLVAQDLGATLRHEFFHVLHWREMDRLGQVHPIWIQEGLASLVEDMDPVAIVRRRGGALPGAEDGALGDDAFIPVPSWRTNIVRRVARTGGLPRFSELGELDHQTFSNRRPLATYAHARTVFLFLHDLGVLGAWYRVYTTDAQHGFASDRRGLAAMERVLGMELPAIEARYREWVTRELPEVAETGGDLRAVIGVDIEQGEGDGPVVSATPGASRRRTGLRRLDVITAIDGRPVRDMKELVRVLSDYDPGETVTISYRRVRLHGTTRVTLLPRE